MLTTCFMARNILLRFKEDDEIIILVERVSQKLKVSYSALTKLALYDFCKKYEVSGNEKEKKLALVHFLVSLFIGVSLILPSLLFYWFGLIGQINIKFSWILVLSATLPFIVLLLFEKSAKRKVYNLYYLFIIIASQMFLFSLGHGDYIAWAHLISGLIYGILYL